MRCVTVCLAILLTACTGSATNGQQTNPTPAEQGGQQAATSTAAPEDSGSGLVCWSNVPTGDTVVSLVDVTADAGLVEPLTGMYGHAAIWTDIDADGWPDLYVGTFADRDDSEYQERGAEGPSPDRLLLGSGEAFATDDSLPEVFSRTSGGATADLDNDGDLDLVVSRNADSDDEPTTILRNDDGLLSPVIDSGMPARFGGRSVGVLDYDGDGLLDLFIAEDRWTGRSSRLLRNEGDLVFGDVTEDAGIPDDVHGLGVSTADLNGDGFADVFVAGSNRLFYGSADGVFDEGDSSVFEWEVYGEEDDVSGVSVADVNLDGLLDIALGHHYNSTWEFDEEVPVRLYLNQGDRTFADVTEESGLIPLPTKAPHVELNDFDNDGLVDLLASASAGAGPAIFLNTGIEDGVPVFAVPEGIGELQYWVAAPSTDYDHDGRLDIFLVEWEPAIPSLLFRNEGGGNWLEVSMDASEGFGIGWRVEVRDGDDLIGAREITVTQGYSSGVLPIAHFGLGDRSEAEVTLIPPRGGDPVSLGVLPANQHIRWPNGC